MQGGELAGRRGVAGGRAVGGWRRWWKAGQGVHRRPHPPPPMSLRLLSARRVGSPLLQQAAEIQLARVFGLRFTPAAVERGA